MPYNTTAIPPRQEVTGQAQLPLSRVKKIIAQDQDTHMCSNNAAFVITLATEMFVQYLAEEGLNMAKLDRKPRRNIQYKDIANAVSHKDNLEFLSDMVPKTVPYKQIKSQAAATRAKVTGDGSASASASGMASPAAGAGGAGAEDVAKAPAAPTNGAGSHKKHKVGKRSSNTGPNVAELLSSGVPSARPVHGDDELEGPDNQLQSEAMRGRDGDVSMSG